MVKINPVSFAKVGDNPIMPVHQLKAKADTRQFKKDDEAKCFISKMSDGRFAVTDANFKNFTKYYEVFTEKELHESFDETE